MSSNIIVIVVTIWLSSTTSWAQTLKKNRPVMDTVASVQVPAKNSSAFNELWAIADRVAGQLSRDDVDSEISQINRTRKSAASSELIQLIQRALFFHEVTGGYFDCAVGTKSEDPVPKQKTLKKQPNDLIKINGNEVVLTAKDVRLDLERLKEGYLVDLMAEHLRKSSIKESVVRVGDVTQCLGVCQVEISNPYTPSENWAVLQGKIDQLSISTFNFQKKYLAQSEKQKLLDPKTGRESATFAGVTILTTGDATRASAFASAIALMPEAHITRVLSRYPDMAFILVYRSGEIRTSSNLYDFVSSARFSPETWANPSMASVLKSNE